MELYKSKGDTVSIYVGRTLFSVEVVLHKLTGFAEGDESSHLLQWAHIFTESLLCTL